MKRSTDRILTTHAGRLDGPPEYREMTLAMMSGKPVDVDEVRRNMHTGMIDEVQEHALDFVKGHEVATLEKICEAVYDDYQIGRASCRERV